MNRRHFLRRSLHTVPAAAAAPTLLPALGGAAESGARPIAVTDWTIGARAQFAAFDRAAEIGLDGVQVSFHPEPQEGDDYDLGKTEGREALQEKAATSGVEIASTAMGIFNRHPFKSLPEAVEWARRGVEATAALEKEVMLMAFFGKNDLKDDAEGTAATIERLRQVAPVAEDHGVILGLETTLSGEEHLHILEEVDSPAVQVYYDTGNSHDNGYDILAEIRELGNGRICEVHCKDKGGWLFGEGDVDFPAALEALDDIGYGSWLVLEGRSAEGLDTMQTLDRNARYLRSLHEEA